MPFKVGTLTAIVALLAGCSVASETLQTPPDAYDVRYGQSSESRNVTFRQPARFPDAAAIGYYDQTLARKGWTRCTSVAAGWGELSTVADSKIYELYHAGYVSPDRETFVFVAVRVTRQSNEEKPFGAIVEQEVRVLLTPIRSTVGTDLYSYATRCEQPPLDRPQTDRDRFPPK